MQNDFFDSIGQSRKCSCLHGTSVVPSIVLQNSFWITEDKFSGLWARPSNDRAGDHSRNRDELTGNFGSALEDTSIGDYRLIALFAEKTLNAIFGVLQHYPLKSGRRQAQAEVHSIARVSSHPYPAQLAKMPRPAPEPARA